MTLPERSDDLAREYPAIYDKLSPCRKKPIIIQSVRMDEEFRVQTLKGDYKQGKAGDFLMCGIDGELYICDREIYEKTYDSINQ